MAKISQVRQFKPIEGCAGGLWHCVRVRFGAHRCCCFVLGARRKCLTRSDSPPTVVTAGTFLFVVAAMGQVTRNTDTQLNTHSNIFTCVCVQMDNPCPSYSLLLSVSL